MDEDIRRSFKELVQRRLELKGHYRDQDKRVARGEKEAWEAELEEKWEKWAEVEKRLRDLVWGDRGGF